jgi:hypothetical protein
VDITLSERLLLIRYVDILLLVYAETTLTCVLTSVRDSDDGINISRRPLFQARLKYSSEMPASIYFFPFLLGACHTPNTRLFYSL